MIFYCNIHVSKVSGKVSDMIKDFLEEREEMSVDQVHVNMSCTEPASPFDIVDGSDEFHQELMEDGQRIISDGNGHDDGVHIDADLN